MTRALRCLLEAQLMICAAGYGVRVDGLPPVLVCGRPPGHAARERAAGQPVTHHDVQWPVKWKEPEKVSAG